MLIRDFLKILTLLFILFTFGFTNQVQKDRIAVVAQNFLDNAQPFNTGISYNIKEIHALKRAESGQLYAHVVHLKPKGFILFSANEQIHPVLGYAYNNNFVGKQTTLDMVQQDVQSWELSIQSNSEQAKKNNELWIGLENTALLSAEQKQELFGVAQQNSLNKKVHTIHYFPTPTWGQGYVNGKLTFNYYTPNKWSTGCVAASMAMVMGYYRWPLWGQSSHCYTEDDAGYICADYNNTTYKWDAILDKYIDSFTTVENRKAVGLLQYHSAISVNMDFENSGSTASTSDAPNAFHNYFHHSGHYSSVGSSGFWNAMQNNMKNARPAILSINTSSGAGHAVVVDGYAETNGYFHLNMGWDGKDNGFYNIQGSWNAGGYSIVNGAVKGIVPNPIVNPQTEQISALKFKLSWFTSSKMDAEYYQVQQATSYNGTWKTLSSTWPDTVMEIEVAKIGNYYYRVRARRDNIWWDWSEKQKITLGGDRHITFNVDMQHQNLAAGDSLVIRGNLAPLSANINSPALTDTGNDNIYSITLPFDVEHAGKELLYRYFIAGPAGTKYEADTRSYNISWDAQQNIDTVFYDNIISSIKDEKLKIVKNFNLIKNWPNPFNPSTNIQIKLAKTGTVELAVWSVLGHKIQTLYRGLLTAGDHNFKWNGRNKAGDVMPTGTYFIRLKQDGKPLKTLKITLSK